jgi:hypothetical protein
MNESTEKKTEQLKNSVPEVKPNENGGFYFSSHVKIYDPNTKEVLVQKRGDN